MRVEYHLRFYTILYNTYRICNQQHDEAYNRSRAVQQLPSKHSKMTLENHPINCQNL